MNNEEDIQIRLFGFRMDNTAAIILFFIALTAILNEIPYLYFYGLDIIQMFEYTIPELFTPSFIIRIIFNFFIPLIITVIFFYVLIISTTIQKYYDETEERSFRWFGFRLTKTPIIILLIFSILFLSLDLRNYVNSINAILEVFDNLPYYPPEYVNLYLLMIGTSLVIFSIYIYTVMICLKNRRNFR